MDSKLHVEVCKDRYFFEVSTNINGYIYTYVESIKSSYPKDFQKLKTEVINRANESFKSKVNESPLKGDFWAIY